jgi:hypothetical protein
VCASRARSEASLPVRTQISWYFVAIACSGRRSAIVDRADSADLDHVVLRGRALMRDGAITLVDETRVRTKFAEAATNRLWRYAADERRNALELPAELESFVLQFYERWTSEPVAPGYAYNTMSGPITDSR